MCTYGWRTLTSMEWHDNEWVITMFVYMYMVRLWGGDVYLQY